MFFGNLFIDKGFEKKISIIIFYYQVLNILFLNYNIFLFF